MQIFIEPKFKKKTPGMELKDYFDIILSLEFSTYYSGSIYGLTYNLSGWEPAQGGEGAKAGDLILAVPTYEQALISWVALLWALQLHKFGHWIGLRTALS